MPFTGDSSDSSDGEEYLEGSGSTPRPGAAQRFSFFFLFFFLSLFVTKLSPGANFYCLRCFSRQSILVATVFSFLFEAIYYKLGRVHTTPQRLSYRRQFSYMGIFSGKKTFKITTAAVYPSIAQQKEVLRQTLSSVFSLSEKSYVGSSLSDLKLWNSGLLDLVCKLFTFESSSSSQLSPFYYPLPLSSSFSSSSLPLPPSWTKFLRLKKSRDFLFLDTN